MCNKKIFICVLTSFFFLVCVGSVIAADFDHSMKFTNEEISAISLMDSPTYAATRVTDLGDSMAFTSEEISAISLMDSPTYAAARVTDLGDSMAFTSEEINAIGQPCTEYC